MTLNEKQIETLFRFCEKKFVPYYDLQAELVDHLAERIEEELTANASLRFDDALQKVYAGFGLFGFAHIVQQKTAALQKQHNQTLWRILKQFFTLPRLVLTATVFLALFTVGKFIPPDLRMFAVMLIWFAGYSYQLISFVAAKRQVKKKLMFTQYVPFTLSTFSIVFTNILFFKHNATLGEVPFSFLCLVTVVVCVAAVEVTTKIYAEARRLYPEAFAEA